MSAANEDIAMAGAEDEFPELADFDSNPQRRLKILPGATDTAVSFQIDDEDHTLGNVLRYFINKNPDVEFCGYTIPHPSEAKMNIRIQTWEDSRTTAFEALSKGLDDLMDACDVVTDKFTEARDAFDASKA